MRSAVNIRMTTLGSTCSNGASPRRRLATVLEGYLADLERGIAPDQQTLLAAHPDLADELRPYLDSLQLLHGTTRDIRTAKPTTNGAHGQLTEPNARHIGDYQIIREIGRGGMGIVYEAHQKSLNRQVALKVLPFAAVLDQRQIARFRNEAQAAAQLHHPHIVPVFAVGQELGVYYYAMQYIAGQTLAELIEGFSRSHALRGDGSFAAPRRDQQEESDSAEYLGAHGARAAERPPARSHAERGNEENTRPIAAVSTLRTLRPAEFFRTVARLGKEAAEALQHAHEFGIVHRDIKPSNLLVDEMGKLWVTDFGLARMQTGSGVTLTGDVVGTLRYMSPEQASGQTALVDARTDVYSLGVTLYELLTQQPAFPGDDRQAVVQKIVGEEPISPRRLNPAVPVDLETIVLAAMAKSRDERYASARALADDLECFLAGKPTHARRPTIADRAAKWARRHRPLVLLGACALVALSVISAVGMALLAREQADTSAAFIEAEQNSRAAQRSLERAERHYGQARRAVDQFGMQLADRLLEIPGAESVRRDLLLDTLGYYRQFMADAGDDPQLRHELALAHFKSGVIAAKLGATDDAISEYRAAKELLAKLARIESSPTELLSHLAVTQNNLGLLLAGGGEVELARREYATAITINERLAGQHPADPVFASQLAESQANFGMLLDQTGDGQQAENSLRAAVDVLRPLIESREPKYARNLAIALNNLSFVLRNGEPEAAKGAVDEAIAILERLAKEHPNQVQFQEDLALCYNNAASLTSRRENSSEAIDWHTRAITLQERLTRKAPAVVRHRSDLAISLNNLGVAYCRAGRADDADAAFGRARELLATLAGDYPDAVAYQSSLAALLNNQALALAAADRDSDALKIYAQAIDSQRICWQRRPESPLMREVLSKLYFNYGQSLRNVGRLADAGQAALDRREVWRGNGERLLGVAAELATIAEESRTKSDTSAADGGPQQLDNEVLATLRLAHESGWPRDIDIAKDERFASLSRNERYAAAVAELKDHTSRRVGLADSAHPTPTPTEDHTP
jgi:serine/threonine protein kinase/tetratricopeptide (TPR) repeat protein